MAKTKYNLGAEARYSHLNFLVTLNDCKMEDFTNLYDRFDSLESWHDLTPELKHLHLKIRHEEDHHRMLNSTVVGSFLWLLDQVILRDVSYLSQKTADTGIYESPFEPVLNDKTKLELVLSELGPVYSKVFLNAKNGLENLLFVRKVLVGRKSYHEFRDLTCGKFSESLNNALVYMSDRLGVDKPPRFEPRNPFSPVFDNDESFNARDIFECHAIIMEIAAAQTYGDQTSVNLILDRASQGPFSFLFEQLQSRFRSEVKNLSGISTASANTVLLLSLCVPLLPSLDVADRYNFDGLIPLLANASMEDVLPWKIVSKALKDGTEKGVAYQGNDLALAYSSICVRACTPLFTTEAKWSEIPLIQGIEDLTELGIRDHAQVNGAIALNTACFVIHQGLSQTVEILGDLVNPKIDRGAMMKKWSELDMRFRKSFPVYELEDQFWINLNNELLNRVDVGGLNLSEGLEQLFTSNVSIAFANLFHLVVEDQIFTRYFDWLQPMNYEKHLRKLETLGENNPWGNFEKGSRLAGE